MTTTTPEVPLTNPAPRVYPGNNVIHISSGNHEVAIQPTDVAHLIDALIEAKRLVS